ncbi:hypothetical protein [Gordonia malaquae]|uniref:hypothetical protein n=1 Tax=Gordonia malaquae TaxID=410332 RepID=UPI003015A397
MSAASDCDLTVAVCGDCGDIVDTVEPVYECTTCGQLTDERRCADCNRFTARAEHSIGCEICFAAVDTEAAALDHDGALIRAADFDPDGPSKADRTRTARAVAVADAAARLDQNTHTVRADEIEVGDWIHGPWRPEVVTEIWHPDPRTVLLVTTPCLPEVRVQAYDRGEQIRLENSPHTLTSASRRGGYMVGSVYATEITIALVPRHRCTILLVTAAHGNVRQIAGVAVSSPAAQELADAFDGFADRMHAAGCTDRDDIIVTNSDRGFFTDTIPPLAAWAFQDAGDYNRPGFLNTATGAFIDSPTLLSTAAAQIRAHRGRLPDH